jgi:hypothetical protein
MTRVPARPAYRAAAVLLAAAGVASGVWLFADLGLAGLSPDLREIAIPLFLLVQLAALAAALSPPWGRAKRPPHSPDTPDSARKAHTR